MKTVKLLVIALIGLGAISLSSCESRTERYSKWKESKQAQQEPVVLDKIPMDRVETVQPLSTKGDLINYYDIDSTLIIASAKITFVQDTLFIHEYYSFKRIK